MHGLFCLYSTFLLLVLPREHSCDTRKIIVTIVYTSTYMSSDFNHRGTSYLPNLTAKVASTYLVRVRSPPPQGLEHSDLSFSLLAVAPVAKLSHMHRQFWFPVASLPGMSGCLWVLQVFEYASWDSWGRLPSWPRTRLAVLRQTEPHRQIQRRAWELSHNIVLGVWSSRTSSSCSSCSSI